MKIARLCPIALLMCLLVVSCGPRSEDGITVAGSTSIQPFAEMLAEEFALKNPGLAVSVQGGGSTAGVQSVRERAAAIGMVSRELEADERDMTVFLIARDGIAVVVNPGNPVGDLSVAQIRGIFAGRIKEWSEVGGRGPVRVVTREEGSGTRGAFEQLVMKKDRISQAAIVQDSNGSVREVIKGDPCGIGYISLGVVNSDVKALKIDGVAAAPETVKSKAYPFVRPFAMITAGQPDGTAKQYLDFVLSDEGQRLLEQEGLIRAK